MSELGRAGQVVAGKFRLDARIGRGGMGSVWRATHLTLGHQVALKLIGREFVRSPDALKRFESEARTAARLQSRHVVQVFDNGTLDDGTPFIAMELLVGEDLANRVATRGAIGLAEAVDITAQCCRALGRAHAEGIVHRDVKPENIYLAQEPDEQAYVVKILDFGLAKMALALDGQEQVTRTGDLLGTPLYMSPEHIRSSRDVDHRTDLYSLGLVVYMMLTGEVAICGETLGDLVVRICTLPLPRIRAVKPSLPEALEGWFQRACARHAGQRYQSAQEFIDALRIAALGTPEHQGRAFAKTAPAANPASPAMGYADLGPPLAQSAAALSVTAAGLPHRSLGTLVLGGAIALLVSLAGAAIYALSPHVFRSGVLAGPPASAAFDISSAAPRASALSLAPAPDPARDAEAPSTTPSASVSLPLPSARGPLPAALGTARGSMTPQNGPVRASPRATAIDVGY